MTDTTVSGPRIIQRGLWFEEMELGATYEHRPGRTITEADNTWFTAVTMKESQPPVGMRGVPVMTPVTGSRLRPKLSRGGWMLKRSTVPVYDGKLGRISTHSSYWTGLSE